MAKRHYTQERTIPLRGDKGTIRVRLLASPGAGKTLLAELLAAALDPEEPNSNVNEIAGLLRGTASRIVIESARDG